MMIPPGRTELQRARDWSTALAAALDIAARDVGDLARRLATGWPDDHGRLWSERLLTLRTSLERDAEAAAGFGREVERVADGPLGPRLGGTGGRRVDDERGVRIPRLDDRENGRDGAPADE